MNFRIVTGKLLRGDGRGHTAIEMTLSEEAGVASRKEKMEWGRDEERKIKEKEKIKNKKNRIVIDTWVLHVRWKYGLRSGDHCWSQG